MKIITCIYSIRAQIFDRIQNGIEINKNMISSYDIRAIVFPERTSIKSAISEVIDIYRKHKYFDASDDLARMFIPENCISNYLLTTIGMGVHISHGFGFSIKETWKLDPFSKAKHCAHINEEILPLRIFNKEIASVEGDTPLDKIKKIASEKVLNAINEEKKGLCNGKIRESIICR